MIRFSEVERYIWLVIVSAILILMAGLTSLAQGTLEKYSAELASIVERVAPSVVSISIERHSSESRLYRYRGEPSYTDEFFFREFLRPGDAPLEKFRVGRGTGIIVDKEGHIVTASHVVDNSRGEIEVELANGSKYKAKIIGTDPDTGVAVIKIDAENLTPAMMSNSDNIKVGELVLAFGNLHDYKGVTVTTGIVSATERDDLNILNYESFIQTDALVGPGSGGGPLVNAAGEVIGMIFAKEGRESMGSAFAVPINTVLEVMEDIIKEGKVTRGWLGVQIQNVSAELAEKLNLSERIGVVVYEVQKGSPAEEGGIEADDVIIEFNGKTVKNVSHLKSMVARTKTDESVIAVVIRKGEKKELTIKMGERTEKTIKAFKDE